MSNEPEFDGGQDVTVQARRYPLGRVKIYEVTDYQLSAIASAGIAGRISSVVWGAALGGAITFGICLRTTPPTESVYGIYCAMLVVSIIGLVISTVVWIIAECHSFHTRNKVKQQSEPAASGGPTETQSPKKPIAPANVLKPRLEGYATAPMHSWHKMLCDRRWGLVYNRREERSKAMTFLPNGVVGEGRNENEFGWRVNNGVLEFLRKDGRLQNRFVYSEAANAFRSTDDAEVLALPGQILQVMG
jgi:hypothetical protein